jgi:hypothetical protein
VNVFGDSIWLSGIAMYQALNQRVRLCGGAWIDSPPLSYVVPDIGDVASVVASAAGELTTLTFTPVAPLGPYCGLYIFSTLAILGNRTPARSEFRLVNLAARALYPSGAEISASWKTRFPHESCPVGKYMDFFVAQLDLLTGAISPAVKLHCPITPD